MAWSTDKIFRFIKELEAEEAIWNPKHVGHKDRNVVNDSWTRLQQKFGMPINELKRKKDGILATYRKYAKKVAHSKKSWNGTHYKPTWSFYVAIDRFLHSVYVPGPGKTINSGETENDGENDKADSATSENEDASDLPSTSTVSQPDLDNPEHKNTANKPSTTTQISVRHNKRTTTSPISMRRNKKRRKLSQTEQVQNQMDAALKILKASVARRNSKPEKGHLELFTDLLLIKLRGMDGNTQELAMHEIDNLMFRLKNPQVSAMQSANQPSTSASMYFQQSRQTHSSPPECSPQSQYLNPLVVLESGVSQSSPTEETQTPTSGSLV